MIPGKNIRLWPLERMDLQKNYQWANDSELARLAGSTLIPKAFFEIEQWYNHCMADPEIQIFAIKLADGTYIGNIELRDLDLRCGCAEIGIVIGESSYIGKGYGKDAIKTICHFAFEDIRLHRLYVKVLASNPRALKTFEDCGFHQEGIEREAFFQNGKYWNIHILGLLDREFTVE